MDRKTTTFKIPNYLQNSEDIREFLNEVLETGNTSDFVHALRIAAKSQGLSDFADTLLIGEDPEFKNVVKAVKALGLKMVIK